MTQLGIHLSVLMGPSVPVPVSSTPLEALDNVEVTHRDQGRSGFQITFKVGRSGPADMLDFNLMSHQALRPFSRVILMVTFNAIPRVLMDGIITQQQLSPQNQPGSSRMVITGPKARAGPVRRCRVKIHGSMKARSTISSRASFFPMIKFRSFRTIASSLARTIQRCRNF